MCVSGIFSGHFCSHGFFLREGLEAMESFALQPFLRSAWFYVNGHSATANRTVFLDAADHLSASSISECGQLFLSAHLEHRPHLHPPSGRGALPLYARTHHFPAGKECNLRPTRSQAWTWSREAITQLKCRARYSVRLPCV